LLCCTYQNNAKSLRFTVSALKPMFGHSHSLLLYFPFL